MIYRSPKSIALEKITKQMISREATEKVLEESSRNYLEWLADTSRFASDASFEYWIINVYQPPKPTQHETA